MSAGAKRRLRIGAAPPRARTLPALPLLALLAACGDDPSGPPVAERRPAERPAAHTDEAGLWRAIDRAERDIARSPRRLRDPALEDYLQGVLCRLGGAHCRDMRIYVMRVPEAGAVVAPNGMVLVFSGLLLRAENEAQLAVVLGHELAHFIERHSLAAHRKDREDTRTAMIFALATASLGAVPLAVIPMHMAEQGMLAFSREQELAADRRGLELMAAAGYAPDAALELWRQVLAESAADPHHRAPDPLHATHPAQAERLAAAEQVVRRIAAPGRDLGAERHLDRVRPYRARFLDDELQLRQPERLLLLLSRLQRLEPGAPDLSHYEAEARRLRAAPGDAAAARAAYRRALQTDPGFAAAWRGLGLLEREAGNHAAARDALTRYLDIQPEAPDASFLRSYLAAGG